MGDKLRIRSGDRAGQRGIAVGEDSGQIIVALMTGEELVLARDQMTNFSLAARRAWKVMPKRAGRPKAQGERKTMVSLRLEHDVKRRLSLAAEMGLIRTREDAVNGWLRECLDRLFSQEGVPELSVQTGGRVAIGLKEMDRG